MIWNYLQIGIFLLTLACLIIPLGKYMAYVFGEAKPGGATELRRWEVLYSQSLDYINLEK